MTMTKADVITSYILITDKSMGDWTGCDVSCLSYLTVWGIVSGYWIGSPKAGVTVVVHISPVLLSLMNIYNPWVLVNLSVKWLFVMAYLKPKSHVLILSKICLDGFPNVCLLSCEIIVSLKCTSVDKRRFCFLDIY